MTMSASWGGFPHGEVVAMWVDGHLFWLSPEGRLQTGDDVPSTPCPAVGLATRLLSLVAEPGAIRHIVLHEPAVASCSGDCVAAEALPSDQAAGRLPHQEGLAYYVLRAEASGAQRILAVLCGWPQEVLLCCQSYLAMHEEHVHLTPRARAAVLGSARRMMRAGLVAFAVAYAVFTLPTEPLSLDSLPFALAALAAVRPSPGQLDTSTAR
ncbi:MAG: hypothetical protein ABFD20_05670 [Anaerolineales bacterium]